jgi:hypothetical protein
MIEQCAAAGARHGRVPGWVTRWRAEVGNWASRRWRRPQLPVRRRRTAVLVHRTRDDGWLATITSDDDRSPQHWAELTPACGPRIGCALPTMTGSRRPARIRTASAGSQPTISVRDPRRHDYSWRSASRCAGPRADLVRRRSRTGRCLGSVGVEVSAAMPAGSRSATGHIWTPAAGADRGSRTARDSAPETAELADWIMIRCAATLRPGMSR